MNAPILLTWELQKKSDQHGVLTYRVSNTSNQDIYLFTPLTDMRGGRVMALPSRVYAYWAAPHVVHLTKRIWAVPDDVDVYMPEVPFLTKVAAGKVFEEQLQLPLPLVINFPYRFAADIGTNPARRAVQVAAHGLVFSIAYVAAQTIKSPSQLKAVDGQPWFSLPYGASVENQHIVIGKQLAIEIDVSDIQ